MHFPTSQSVAATLALNTLHSITAPARHSNGCGKKLPEGLVPGGASVNFTLWSEEGGGERRYLVHLPEGFEKGNEGPRGVIVALHAFTQTTGSMEEVTGFSQAEVNGEYVVVYPEGVGNVWLGDPGAPNSTVIDDRPFIVDLLDTLEDTLCIDTSRIYTTGFSNGGGLSGLLACYLPTSHRIAAFSGVSAAYYTTQSLGYALFDEEGCKPGNLPRRIPFLDIHGDSDGVIAYDGDNSRFDIDENGIPDPDTLPIPLWLGDWARRNGCPANATVEDYLQTGDVANSTSVSENGTIAKATWTCGGWSDVVTGYYVKGLGHGWPSTVALSDPLLEEFRGGPTSWNASRVLMEWFSRWSVLGEVGE